MKIAIPSWGLIRAAMTARTDETSGCSRHRARTLRRRKTIPTESTWPHTTLSNQEIGTNR